MKWTLPILLLSAGSRSPLTITCHWHAISIHLFPRVEMGGLGWPGWKVPLPTTDSRIDCRNLCNSFLVVVTFEVPGSNSIMFPSFPFHSALVRCCSIECPCRNRSFLKQRQRRWFGFDLFKGICTSLKAAFVLHSPAGTYISMDPSS